MSNRRERRAQARAGTASSKTRDIPLSQPSRGAPNHKTLLDIASERQLINASTSSQNSSSSVTTTKINADGSLSTFESSTDDPDPIATPYLDVALYTMTLTVLHFTLTVLVTHQYDKAPPSLSEIFYTSTVASPTPVLLLILVAVLHPRASHIVTQLLFATLSVIAGAWLVYASNEDPYMAVMKKAPPLGTLWIWAAVEMRWEWAAGCLGLVAGWGWLKGYRMY